MKNRLFFTTGLLLAISVFGQDQNGPASHKLTQNDMYGDNPNAYVTPSGYALAPEWGVFPFGSFIYWTARETNIEYATVIKEAPATGKILHPNWEWAPGFKAGIGAGSDGDGWETLAQYTWFRNNASSSASVDPNSEEDTIFPNFLQIEGITSATSASGSWRLRFNVIDWEIARNYFVSPFLLMRPFIGLKGTWQTQKYNITYAAFDEEIGDLLNTIVLKQRSWAIGPRLGFNTTWHFVKMFSFFGNLALSGVWTDFRSKKNFTQFEGGEEGRQNINVKDLNILIPVVEFLLGARFEAWFWDNTAHFSLEAGWEAQYWHSQDQFVSTAANLDGDLTLQGLTIQVRLDF